MCRWLAYSGSPILIQEALYEGPNSLVAQSLQSKLGAEPTNGDGFGVGWYGAPDTPGVFHSTEPAWNEHNLRELAGVWNKVPESTYGVVGPDHAEMRPFQPKAPSSPVPV